MARPRRAHGREPHHDPLLGLLPLVTEATRERISREFDDLGPQACVAEITANLRLSNPEVLDMAAKCAGDVGDAERTLLGLAMFYRLLVLEGRASLAPGQAGAAAGLDPLPRVAPQTRGRIARQIDQKGAETFAREALAHMERNNPELLQMAHHFASRQSNYLGMMQGFALIYACLAAQAAADRASVH